MERRVIFQLRNGGFHPARFFRQISLLRHLNHWLVYTWHQAEALTILQTFCFSVHKLHRKHFNFHWLHTFETEPSTLHNSIHRNLFISSSWLTWFLHISLSESATWLNMFIYHAHTYLGFRNHLLSRLDELYTFQLMARAGLCLRHTLHVHSITILTFTPPIHHTTLSRLSYHIPAMSLSRVHAMIPITWPTGTTPYQYLYPQKRTATRRHFLLHV